MKFVISLLALLSAVQTISWAQQSSKPGTQTAPVVNSPAKPQPKASVRSGQPRPDEGTIVGDTYSEKFFNLSCAIPPGWTLKTKEMREGLAGQENSMLLLSAFEKDAPNGDHINASLTITAENLAAYPNVKTADDYFEALSGVVTTKGFTVLNEPAEVEVGGVTFLRGDFQSQDEAKKAYQATMVAVRKGYVLAITAISGNEEQLTPLLNRVHVIAPPTLGKSR